MRLVGVVSMGRRGERGEGRGERGEGRVRRGIVDGCKRVGGYRYRALR